MPFDCDLEEGRIKLSPAAERSYPIIEGREAQAVTVCNPRVSAACRTIMAHRFDIACGGTRLAWMRVAAAIRLAGSTPAWIKDGRLNVVLPVRHASDKPSCMDRPTFSLGRTSKEDLSARNCRPAYRDNFDLVALPQGFAPVSELGARLALAVDTDSSAAFDQESTSDAVAEPVLARGDPDAVIDPITGQPDTYDAGQRAHEWITVVRAEAAPGIRARHHAADTAQIWTWFAFALLFGSAAGLVRVRMLYARTKELCQATPRWTSVFGQRAMRLWWDRRSGQSSRRFTNAGGAVTSLLEGTESVVAGLKDAGPLREVLQEELALVRRHVSSVDAVAGEAELSAARTAAQFRGLVRELERIRRIADSAAASLAGGRSGSTLPRTASEAYAVLGVNADASAPVLKKIVDALRMTWHPDHARGEDDRRLRDERIRQINVAWELINARRVEA
jgi:hypothetical protein